MIYALYFIHIIISIFLILVVLLQQGKGADLSVFGGGGTQVAFGARGAATLLHKLTVTCFILFLVTTLTLGILSARSAPSVMSAVATEEPADDNDALAGPAGGTLDEPEPATESGTADAATDEATTAVETPEEQPASDAPQGDG